MAALFAGVVASFGSLFLNHCSLTCEEASSSAGHDVCDLSQQMTASKRGNPVPCPVAVSLFFLSIKSSACQTA